MFKRNQFKKMDFKKIEGAIENFEAEVDFELVPVITERSSYDEHIPWIMSLLFIILFVGLTDYFFQESWASRTLYYVLTPVVAVFLGILLDKSDWLDRFFISKKERDRQVLEKAQRVFFLSRLDHIKSRQSMLLFISIMEKKIVILPDPNMKLENLQQLENNLLKVVQAAFKKGHYEQGFLDAIAFLKSELKAKFPQTEKGAANHFSNKLIWWDV